MPQGQHTAPSPQTHQAVPCLHASACAVLAVNTALPVALVWRWSLTLEDARL